MADIKWVKLDTGLFDNRKIKQIRTLPEGDSLVVIWLQLICLAGNTNDGGLIYFTKEVPYTDQMLATAFGESLATVQLALRTFEAFGMIEVVNDIICLSNWEKYQAVEGMERIREQTRKRVANYRQKQKLLECNVTVTQGNADVTQQNKNKKENKNKSKDTTIRRFTPPTLEEVTAYVQERGNLIDPKKFFDYYETAGWKDSKGQPVKNWKQKAITWEGRGTQTPKSKLPDFENINGYHELEKKEPMMSPEEAKEWYDNLIKELQDGQI